MEDFDFNDRVKRTLFDQSIRIEGLEKENAKLREFATVLWQMVTQNEPRFTWEGMEEVARELGIETSDE